MSEEQKCKNKKWEKEKRQMQHNENREDKMRNYKILYLTLVLIVPLALAFASAVLAASSNDSIFQVSVIRATVEGLYDGVISAGELKKHGDLGIGTFERLDGEMVDLDGLVYQLKADGTTMVANDSMRVPLAIVTFFRSDRNLSLNRRLNFTQLETFLDSQIPTRNIFYAFRIDGIFDYVKTRSVPAQSKPYPPLAEAVKNQSTLEFRNKSGTIVGFRYPAFARDLGLPGYHMHFITSDRSSGGHLLDCQVENATVKIDDKSDFEMVLPEDKEFYGADLSGEKQEELKKAESNPTQKPKGAS